VSLNYEQKAEYTMALSALTSKNPDDSNQVSMVTMQLPSCTYPSVTIGAVEDISHNMAEMC
jgi:hypothetical protein